ncbi:hypothetical protein SI65_04206 [Aspergillus cristatus]|uniref:TEL2-interacting protein 1 n=1 Tax=Aspergillus cristatus TaxID=573508 RepID=A0A1E3BJJ2_ASPCR|nr:hypothetical protein SI65_04206 [Aspergillus cristatus]
MENSRQESFRKLRPTCVELSAVGLRFRGHQATSDDVARALEPLHNTLKELADKNALDEKLAEYAFFPLSHILNETQRISARCLELTVNCLRILVAKGWRQHLSPMMGKQLIILLTLIVGGVPNRSNESHAASGRPEELIIAGFNCFSAIFDALGGPLAEKTVYNEIGTATIVDQTVYILLEGVVDSRSDDLCLAAARALQGLYRRITDRVVLASIMPRTVSALTKVLKPTTQIRRSYRLSVICLEVLTHLLKTVLNDRVASTTEKPVQPETGNDTLVLDDSWLKATTTQIKLALANVVQIRRHERLEVQAALLDLCLMVIEDCQNTLQDSIPIMVETIVVLSDMDEEQTPNTAYSSLRHLATVYPTILDSLKDSLNSWVTSFPRTMQGNDETAKQWGIKQISTVFHILSQVQSGSDLLTTGLTGGLCDSVSAVVGHTANTLQPVSLDPTNNLSLEVAQRNYKSMTFPPVLMEHRSQQQTLIDLDSMVTRLSLSDSGSEITGSIIGRMHNASGNAILAPFWLSLTFLKNSSQATTAFDDFIASDYVDFSMSPNTRSNMIEDLYYISLAILNEPLVDDSRDWRVSALALEAVALQAQQLGEAFRPELMDALYPVLQLLASSNSNLQNHAMTCLNILTTACNYDGTSSMIIENVDYLVNAVGLKLNTFDVSPYPPQVLLMMIKLCGARLIPYLDDLIGSIFGILDIYHGYPKLTEMMFKTLAAIVEEGAKTPSVLAITEDEDDKRPDHRKRQYEGLDVSTLVKDFAARKSKRTKFLEDEAGDTEKSTHPKQPWTLESERLRQPEPSLDSAADLMDKMEGETDEPLPEPREPEDTEKPLTKSHTLLLNIMKSIPSHLSSPSPYLRRSLLSIVIQIFPVLSQNETSFLPLINDLWPSVVSRISFPSSAQDVSSSNSLMTRDAPAASADRAEQRSDEFEIREETYVITTAIETVQVICSTAGDFMASRIETEFPRWERLYRRAWDKVRQDAERALDRRAARRLPKSASPSEPSFSFVQSLALATATSSVAPAGTPPSHARTFTPHHSLWRALASLFLTLLTHVRLPLSMGDQICEFLGAWIARYAGPDYYFAFCRSSSGTEAKIPESLKIEARTVDDTIQTMETWNADLTWFIFQQERTRVRDAAGLMKTGFQKRDDVAPRTPSLLGGRLRFAEVVF